MPTVVDRDRTVDLLRGEFAAVGELVASLTDEQWATPTCLTGWTVKDVLSHMVGTESMLSGVPLPAVGISHLDHMKNAIAETNELWVESLRASTGHQVAERWSEISSARLSTLDGMGQAEFDAPSWTPVGADETYGRFMRIRHFDCFMHEQDIRLALGLAPRTDPDHQAFCLDEVATGLGYIVGRRARMPDGSRVTITLTGQPARTYRILVDGRASVVAAFDGAATVGIELPVPLFLRLTGGRDDHQPIGTGEVRCSGDLVLARRLSEHLAFTI